MLLFMSTTRINILNVIYDLFYENVNIAFSYEVSDSLLKSTTARYNTKQSNKKIIKLIFIIRTRNQSKEK